MGPEGELTEQGRARAAELLEELYRAGPDAGEGERPLPSPRAYHFVHLEEKGGARHLTNAAPVAIKSVTYASRGIHSGVPHPDDVTFTARPVYRIHDLPSGAMVKVEDVDPYEDGPISFVVERVEWADGVVEEGPFGLGRQQGYYELLATKKMDELRKAIKAVAVPVSERVEREPEPVRTDPGGTIRTGERSSEAGSGDDAGARGRSPSLSSKFTYTSPDQIKFNRRREDGGPDA